MAISFSVSSLAKNIATTRWMLDHGAKSNPNVRADENPLKVAAKNASVDTVKLLLERGADPKKSIAAVHAINRQDDN